MTKMSFKGSMPAPKHEHGEAIPSGVNDKLGVVHHRRYNDKSKVWEYGLLVEGWPMIAWVREN